MGGVTDRYLRHDGAGDMHVGRTVAGLPFDSPRFAILPPRFSIDSPPPCVHAAKRVCFPGLPAAVNGVGEFALASLVHHLPFLRLQLPPSHPVFSNPLFSDSQLVAQVQAALVQESDNGAPDLVPTGIPPHVALMARIERLEGL